MLELQEGQSELLTGFGASCQMVSFVSGFTELFPPLSASLLGLTAVISAGGSTESEEQRGNVVCVRKDRKMR